MATVFENSNELCHLIKMTLLMLTTSFLNWKPVVKCRDVTKFEFENFFGQPRSGCLTTEGLGRAL